MEQLLPPVFIVCVCVRQLEGRSNASDMECFFSISFHPIHSPYSPCEPPFNPYGPWDLDPRSIFLLVLRVPNLLRHCSPDGEWNGLSSLNEKQQRGKNELCRGGVRLQYSNDGSNSIEGYTKSNQPYFFLTPQSFLPPKRKHLSHPLLTRHDLVVAADAARNSLSVCISLSSFIFLLSFSSSSSSYIMSWCAASENLRHQLHVAAAGADTSSNTSTDHLTYCSDATHQRTAGRAGLVAFRSSPSMSALGSHDTSPRRVPVTSACTSGILSAPAAAAGTGPHLQRHNLAGMGSFSSAGLSSSISPPQAGRGEIAGASNSSSNTSTSRAHPYPPSPTWMTSLHRTSRSGEGSNSPPSNALGPSTSPSFQPPLHHLLRYNNNNAFALSSSSATFSPSSVVSAGPGSSTGPHGGGAATARGWMPTFRGPPGGPAGEHSSSSSNSLPPHAAHLPAVNHTTTSTSTTAGSHSWDQQLLEAVAELVELEKAGHVRRLLQESKQRHLETAQSRRRSRQQLDDSAMKKKRRKKTKPPPPASQTSGEQQSWSSLDATAPHSTHQTPPPQRGTSPSATGNPPKRASNAPGEREKGDGCVPFVSKAVKDMSQRVKYRLLNRLLVGLEAELRCERLKHRLAALAPPPLLELAQADAAESGGAGHTVHSSFTLSPAPASQRPGSSPPFGVDPDGQLLPTAGGSSSATTPKGRSTTGSNGDFLLPHSGGGTSTAAIQNQLARNGTAVSAPAYLHVRGSSSSSSSSTINTGLHWTAAAIRHVGSGAHAGAMPGPSASPVFAPMPGVSGGLERLLSTATTATVMVPLETSSGAVPESSSPLSRSTTSTTGAWRGSEQQPPPATPPLQEEADGSHAVLERTETAREAAAQQPTQPPSPQLPLASQPTAVAWDIPPPHHLSIAAAGTKAPPPPPSYQRREQWRCPLPMGIRTYMPMPMPWAVLQGLKTTLKGAIRRKAAAAAAAAGIAVPAPSAGPCGWSVPPAAEDDVAVTEHLFLRAIKSLEGGGEAADGESAPSSLVGVGGGVGGVSAGPTYATPTGSSSARNGERAAARQQSTTTTTTTGLAPFVVSTGTGTRHHTSTMQHVCSAGGNPAMLHSKRIGAAGASAAAAAHIRNCPTCAANAAEAARQAALAAKNASSAAGQRRPHSPPPPTVHSAAPAPAPQSHPPDPEDELPRLHYQTIAALAGLAAYHPPQLAVLVHQVLCHHRKGDEAQPAEGDDAALRLPVQDSKECATAAPSPCSSCTPALQPAEEMAVLQAAETFVCQWLLIKQRVTNAFVAVEAVGFLGEVVEHLLNANAARDAAAVVAQEREEEEAQIAAAYWGSEGPTATAMPAGPAPPPDATQTTPTPPSLTIEEEKEVAAELEGRPAFALPTPSRRTSPPFLHTDEEEDVAKEAGEQQRSAGYETTTSFPSLLPFTTAAAVQDAPTTEGEPGTATEQAEVSTGSREGGFFTPLRLRTTPLAKVDEGGGGTTTVWEDTEALSKADEGVAPAPSVEETPPGIRLRWSSTTAPTSSSCASKKRKEAGTMALLTLTPAAIAEAGPATPHPFPAPAPEGEGILVLPASAPPSEASTPTPFGREGPRETTAAHGSTAGAATDGETCSSKQASIASRAATAGSSRPAASTTTTTTTTRTSTGSGSGATSFARHGSTTTAGHHAPRTSDGSSSKETVTAAGGCRSPQGGASKGSRTPRGRGGGPAAGRASGRSGSRHAATTPKPSAQHPQMLHKSSSSIKKKSASASSKHSASLGPAAGRGKGSGVGGGGPSWAATPSASPPRRQQAVFSGAPHSTGTPTFSPVLPSTLPTPTMAIASESHGGGGGHHQDPPWRGELPPAAGTAAAPPLTTATGPEPSATVATPAAAGPTGALLVTGPPPVLRVDTCHYLLLFLIHGHSGVTYSPYDGVPDGEAEGNTGEWGLPAGGGGDERRRPSPAAPLLHPCGGDDDSDRPSLLYLMQNIGVVSGVCFDPAALEGRLHGEEKNRREDTGESDASDEEEDNEPGAEEEEEEEAEEAAASMVSWPTPAAMAISPVSPGTAATAERSEPHKNGEENHHLRPLASNERNAEGDQKTKNVEAKEEGNMYDDDPPELGYDSSVYHKYDQELKARRRREQLQKEEEEKKTRENKQQQQAEEAPQNDHDRPRQSVGESRVEEVEEERQPQAAHLAPTPSTPCASSPAPSNLREMSPAGGTSEADSETAAAATLSHRHRRGPVMSAQTLQYLETLCAKLRDATAVSSGIVLRSLLQSDVLFKMTLQHPCSTFDWPKVRGETYCSLSPPCTGGGSPLSEEQLPRKSNGSHTGTQPPHPLTTGLVYSTTTTQAAGAGEEKDVEASSQHRTPIVGTATQRHTTADTLSQPTSSRLPNVSFKSPCKKADPSPANAALRIGDSRRGSLLVQPSLHEAGSGSPRFVSVEAGPLSRRRQTQTGDQNMQASAGALAGAHGELVQQHNAPLTMESPSTHPLPPWGQHNDPLSYHLSHGSPTSSAGFFVPSPSVCSSGLGGGGLPPGYWWLNPIPPLRQRPATPAHHRRSSCWSDDDLPRRQGLESGGGGRGGNSNSLSGSFFSNASLHSSFRFHHHHHHGHRAFFEEPSVFFHTSPSPPPPGSSAASAQSATPTTTSSSTAFNETFIGQLVRYAFSPSFTVCHETWRSLFLLLTKHPKWCSAFWMEYMVDLAECLLLPALQPPPPPPPPLPPPAPLPPTEQQNKGPNHSLSEGQDGERSNNEKPPSLHEQQQTSSAAAAGRTATASAPAKGSRKKMKGEAAKKGSAGKRIRETRPASRDEPSSDPGKSARDEGATGTTDASGAGQRVLPSTHGVAEEEALLLLYHISTTPTFGPARRKLLTNPALLAALVQLASMHCENLISQQQQLESVEAEQRGALSSPRQGSREEPLRLRVAEEDLVSSFMAATRRDRELLLVLQHVFYEMLRNAQKPAVFRYLLWVNAAELQRLVRLMRDLLVFQPMGRNSSAGVGVGFCPGFPSPPLQRAASGSNLLLESMMGALLRVGEGLEQKLAARLSGAGTGICPYAGFGLDEASDTEQEKEDELDEEGEEEELEWMASFGGNGPRGSSTNANASTGGWWNNPPPPRDERVTRGLKKSGARYDAPPWTRRPPTPPLADDVALSSPADGFKAVTRLSLRPVGGQPLPSTAPGSLLGVDPGAVHGAAMASPVSSCTGSPAPSPSNQHVGSMSAGSGAGGLGFFFTGGQRPGHGGRVHEDENTHPPSSLATPLMASPLLFPASSGGRGLSASGFWASAAPPTRQSRVRGGGSHPNPFGSSSGIAAAHGHSCGTLSRGLYEIRAESKDLLTALAKIQPPTRDECLALKELQQEHQL
eukprot:gene5848-4171_t